MEGQVHMLQVVEEAPQEYSGPDAVTLPPLGADGAPPPLLKLQEWFVGILNEELEKFNDFYVDKEEDFIIRFQGEHNFNIFGGWLEKISTAGKNYRLLEDLHVHLLYLGTSWICTTLTWKTWIKNHMQWSVISLITSIPALKLYHNLA